MLSHSQRPEKSRLSQDKNNAGSKQFAAVTTAYILVGIYLAERDLMDLFGDEYRGMLAPLRRKS
jgi:hypothetical protein